MVDSVAELKIIEPASERTITAAQLEMPFIYDQYTQLCTEGAQTRKVLVVGSGPNTERWRALGCASLDIDPTANPDIVADANHLGESIHPASQEVIVSECLTLDPSGIRGVNLETFLPQAYTSLVRGGKLFFVSASSITEPPRPTRTVLAPNAFKLLMKNVGFRNIASWSGPILLGMRNERAQGDKVITDGFIMQSAVIYHGQKI